jgi:hypothetical protein
MIHPSHSWLHSFNLPQLRAVKATVSQSLGFTTGPAFLGTGLRLQSACKRVYVVQSVQHVIQRTTQRAIQRTAARPVGDIEQLRSELRSVQHNKELNKLNKVHNVYGCQSAQIQHRTVCLVTT